MKRPDLQYNYYYPFYTQSCIGEKKYYYKVDTIIHISDNKGILLSVGYKQKKVSEIKVCEVTDPKILLNARFDGTLIHYTDFAKVVNKVYRTLSGAVRELSPEKSYVKQLIFSYHFKHSDSVEIEIDYKNIHLKFDEFDYVIENGQRKRAKYTPSDDDIYLKKLQEVVDVIDEKTKYIEIDNAKFNEKLDRVWESFIEFFESPKLIRKNEYKIK